MLHDSITLEVNADSTEWCPWLGHQELLAVGTYQLDEITQERLGIIHIYGLDEGKASSF